MSAVVSTANNGLFLAIDDNSAGLAAYHNGTRTGALMLDHVAQVAGFPTYHSINAEWNNSVTIWDTARASMNFSGTTLNIYYFM